MSDLRPLDIPTAAVQEVEAEMKILMGSRVLCFETYEANDEGCSYVRITDAEGDEIAYWNYEEWVEAPQEVMGAIMGAITAGVKAVSEEDDDE